MNNNLQGEAEGAEHPMDFLLDEDFDLDFPQPGEIRQGEVVAHRDHEILIDIGAKSEGLIVGDELDLMDADTREQLAVGSVVPVFVVNPEDSDGNTILSYRKALEEEDWIQAQALFDSQEVYKGQVIGYNKGGLLVNVGRIRGFVPSSQLSGRRRSGESGMSKEERLSASVGDEILTRVIEVERSRNRLILSERAAMKEIRAEQRAQLLDEIEVGEVRKGRVVNLADFGAFIDIGGMEGLAHLSELSWRRVSHPSDVLEVGDKVDVYVLSIDLERNRVALSLKRLEPDPWTIVDQKYGVGDLVEVVITKLTKYGAFAQVEDEYALEGLIHISELAVERVEEAREVVDVGETVAARIIRINPEQRQLGLSLKQVASADYVETDLAMADGS